MKPARVITDSISATGVRVTTLEVTMHRFVLAEFNTHRAFSRNSASSRARPISKVIASITESPAIPYEWGTNQAGMTPAPPLTGTDAEYCTGVWLEARDAAIEFAKKLDAMNVHKSYVNRLLEPFAEHVCIVTSTEWENFYKQRCHKDAQGEIRVPAEEIEAAIAASTPKLLAYGEWHTPFVQDDEQHLLLLNIHSHNLLNNLSLHLHCHIQNNIRPLHQVVPIVLAVCFHSTNTMRQLEHPIIVSIQLH